MSSISENQVAVIKLSVSRDRFSYAYDYIKENNSCGATDELLRQIKVIISNSSVLMRNIDTLNKQISDEIERLEKKKKEEGETDDN